MEIFLCEARRYLLKLPVALAIFTEFVGKISEFWVTVTRNQTNSQKKWWRKEEMFFFFFFTFPALYLTKFKAFRLRFLLRKPRDLFALLVILVIWGFQDRSLAMSTPKYLAEATASRVWPCSEYWVGIGYHDLVIRVTWHLPGLNSIFKSNSHSRRLFRPSLSCFDSVGFVNGR